MNKWVAYIALLLAIIFIAPVAVNRFISYEDILSKKDLNCDTELISSNGNDFREMPITLGVTDCLIKGFGSFRKFSINSSGGQSLGSLLLADYIEDNGIAIHIKKYCLSACVVVLAASPNGSMCKSAILGVHYSYKPEDNLLDALFENNMLSLMERFQDEIFYRNDIDVDYIRDLKIEAINTEGNIRLINSEEAIEKGLINLVDKSC